MVETERQHIANKFKKIKAIAEPKVALENNNEYDQDIMSSPMIAETTKPNNLLVDETPSK